MTEIEQPIARCSYLPPYLAGLGSVALLLFAACAPREASQDVATAARPAPTAEELAGPVPAALAEAGILDLTYAYGEDTLYWPTSPSTFELERLSYGPTDAGFFYAANAFATPEHGGTHLDAPIHFAEGQQTVDEIPLENLIGPGVVIDVAEQAAADADYRLTVDDVHAWEKIHGPVPRGAIVMLRTGWGARWPDRAAYLGDDTPGDASNLHFPSYGAEAAQYLIEQRGAAALGVDTASIDHGPSRDFPVHQLAGAHNVPGLENVANLDQLPVTGAQIFALPMKIRGGSGGPVRIVAILPGV